jgi:hypothetical protein
MSVRLGSAKTAVYVEAFRISWFSMKFITILELYDFSTAKGTDEFYNRDNEVMEWLLA